MDFSKYIDVLKYLLAIALGAFVAGISTLVFLDQRIQDKLDQTEANKTNLQLDSISVVVDRNECWIVKPNTHSSSMDRCPSSSVVVGFRTQNGHSVQTDTPHELECCSLKVQ